MVFNISVLGGLAGSLDKGFQKSFERIREEIDSTAETQVKREEKAIDAVNKDTKDVMKELRAAQAVLGGTSDPKSAARAAALLKEVGDIDKFKAMVTDLAQYKLNNEETYEFTNYFDTTSDVGNVSLSDAAQNYVLGLRPPTPEISAVQKRGGGMARLFNVDITERARAKSAAQLATLGLTKPEVKDISLPSITFKSEELKLDKMNPDEEMVYLRNKLLDPDTPDEKKNFYKVRMSGIANTMGTDAKIADITFQLNTATDTMKPILMKQLQELNKEKREFDVLSTGNEVDIAKYELEQALAARDTEAANAARQKLVDMGQMSVQDVLKVRTEQLVNDLSQAQTDAERTALQSEIDELTSINTNIQTAMLAIKPTTPPTPTGIKAVMTNVSTIVNRKILDNPEFKGLNLTVRADGSIDFPKGLDENIIQKINDYRAKEEKAYLASMAQAMPKDGDVAFVSNMFGQGYTSEDVEALGGSDDVVTGGAAGDGEAAAPVVVEEGEPAEAAFGAGQGMTEEDKQTVANSITGEHGEVLNEINLENIVTDVAEAMKAADTPTEAVFGVEAAAINPADVQAEATEAIAIAYGPEAAAEFATQIEAAAAKAVEAVVPTGEDVTITRMGKPTTYRKVGDQYFALDEDGNMTNIPVSKTSSLHEQLESQTPFGEATDAADRDEATVDQSVRETGQARLIADFEEQTGVRPDVVADLGLAGKQAYRLIDGQFYRIKADGQVASEPADKFRSDDLRAIMNPSVEPQAETFSEYGEPPADREEPVSKVKGGSIIDLSSKFANGTITEDEAEELARRIEADESGAIALQVQEIMNRISAARGE